MNMNNDIQSNKRSFVRYTYIITVLFLVLSGFGQMPIFKRYYIADIPGLGWLAQFYVTHYIHYLFAIILIGLTSYVIAEYLFMNRKRIKITISGYIRGSLVIGLVITGILLVIRNLAGSGFPPGFIIFLDLAHLGIVMVLLMASLYCIILKKKWAKERL
jgi:hypothetical protein